jgi:hypothetical protein
MQYTILDNEREGGREARSGKGWKQANEQVFWN